MAENYKIYNSRTKEVHPTMWIDVADRCSYAEIAELMKTYAYEQSVDISDIYLCGDYKNVASFVRPGTSRERLSLQKQELYGVDSLAYEACWPRMTKKEIMAAQ